MEKEFRKIITRLLNSLIEKQELKEVNVEFLTGQILKTDIKLKDIKSEQSFLSFLKLNFCTCEGCGNLESYTINNFCTTCIEFITTHKEA
ncbi:hypothetical protein ACIRAF_000810 [Campylobacter upsaliensis]|nr:hypothetical protein [Campylobacter upsaliensis]EAL3987081.1 hypothetical protein [Campylobacter upsaliensis]EHB5117793.1 hypothetical protein [Campylobacter upsaliensis]CAG9470101.1 hypothetical protein CU197059_000588 [Campylobacter upsaliensis]HED8569844.1 hypothetical protein [Campylobacter upsaliensis]